MKKLRPRLYDPKDYNEIKKWAEFNGHLFPPEDMLPGVGAVVEDKDGNLYGCGFLYLTNEVPVCFLEFVYFNPKNKGRETSEAMRHVVKSMEMCAAAEEAPLMITLSPTYSMTKIYEKLEWHASHRNMTQMVRRADLDSNLQPKET